MSNAATLTVRIGADISELKKGLNQASKSIANVGKRLTGLGTAMTKAVTGPIAGLGAGLVALQRSTGEYADQVLDLADVTGLSTDAIQEFRNVARVAGVSTDAMTQSISGLARRMPQIMEGSGRASDAMDSLGVSVRDASGGMRNTEDIMVDVIGALGDIDNAMERAALAQSVLGRRWEQLAPVIGLGADEINKARQQAHDMGMVMDGEALQGANDFRIALSELTSQLAATGRNLAVDLMPIMMDTVIPALQSVSERVSHLIRAFVNLGPEIHKKIALFLGIVAAVGPVITILGGLALAIAAITSPVGLVIASLAALSVAITFVWDNWRAIIERISDTRWWRNTIISMIQFFIDNNPFALIIDGFNAVARRLGMAEIPNPYTALSGTLDKLRVEQKEYEHEFGSLTGALRRGFQEVAGFDLVSIFDIPEIDTQKQTQAVRQFGTSIERAELPVRNFAQSFERIENPDLPPYMEGVEERMNRIAQISEFTTGIVDTFTASFGSGMANVVVQGERLVDTLKNIAKLLASSVIQRGLQVLLTGGLGGTGFFGSGGGLFGRIFSVNDALITSGGDVVKFHPDDNILAMKDFSSIGGTQKVEVFGTIKGNDIFVSSSRGGVNFER